MNPTIQTPPMPPRRSTFITVLAWCMIVAGVVGVPFSVFFVILVLGMSYATQESDPVFCAIMVFGPVLLLATGILLLKRRRPAWRASPGVPAPEAQSQWTTGIPAGHMPTVRETRGRGALIVAILVMAALAAFMAWIVTSHVSSGETKLPAKRASLQRTISRDREPVSYWASISIYSLIGLGSAGLALWGCREAWRLRGGAGSAGN